MIMNTVQTGMLHTNCYLLGDEKLGEGILFDPGASTQKILDMIEQSGVKIKYIVLTHCHFDHVMAAPSIQDATGAELMIHKEDAPYLTPEYVSRKGYIRETYKTPRIDRILEDGDTITLGGISIKVMNTPGHTRGSCVFMLHDAERGRYHAFRRYAFQGCLRTLGSGRRQPGKHDGEPAQALCHRGRLCCVQRPRRSDDPSG